MVLWFEYQVIYNDEGKEKNGYSLGDLLQKNIKQFNLVCPKYIFK